MAKRGFKHQMTEIIKKYTGWPARCVSTYTKSIKFYFVFKKSISAWVNYLKERFMFLFMFYLIPNLYNNSGTHTHNHLSLHVKSILPKLNPFILHSFRLPRTLECPVLNLLCSPLNDLEAGSWKARFYPEEKSMQGIGSFLK